jgi:hypothetical protein
MDPLQGICMNVPAFGVEVFFGGIVEPGRNDNGNEAFLQAVLPSFLPGCDYEIYECIG